MWLDLHDIGSESQLYRWLFDAAEFNAWRTGTDDLYLFLDSFDECRLQINMLHAMLLREFQRCPIERLHVRVACRVADWPPAFEHGLRELFGSDEVGVFELAPLRRADVLLAAETGRVKPDDFMAAVEAARAVPLAIKPLTLDFLVRSFRRHHALPDRMADLYEEGCHLLCDESEARQEIRLPRSLTTTQRLAVAERMAAYSVFSNKAAFFTGVDRGDVPDEDLTLRAIVGDTESAEGASFGVDEAGVGDVLNTGLFSSRGERRLGWAHQTYAEFLAARYVVGRRVSLPQIMSLLIHPDDPDGKLVPQLLETAAWLAGMRSDVLDALLARDPEVVLRSDLNHVADNVRSAVVSALLDACMAGEWVDRDWGLKRTYTKLCHPALAQQLRPYLVSASKESVVRRVAIHIVEECREGGLLTELANLALDDQTELDTRVTAAYAIIDIGGEDFKRLLRPLIDTRVEIDPNWELKGCGLMAVWPMHLTTGELLQVLLPPRTGFFGTYWTFISRDPFKQVPTHELPMVLEWACRQCDSTAVPYEIENLVAELLDRASNHLDSALTFESFGRLAAIRLRHHDAVFDRESLMRLSLNQQRRHGVITAILAMASDDDVWDLLYSRMLVTEDALWLLAQYRQRPETEKLRWGRLLLHVWRDEDVAATDAVLTACQTDEVLAEILAPRVASVRLDSDEAAQQREQYRRMLEREKRQAEELPLLQPSPSDRVAHLLDRFEKGDLTAWWRLNQELTLEPRSTRYGTEFYSDLTSLPGWQESSDQTRGRLITAADRYVRGRTPEPEQWVAVDTGNQVTIHCADWAGFRAFWLLQTHGLERLAALPAEVWIRWASVIVGFQTLNPSEHEAPHQQLVARVYRHAPDQILQTMLDLIDAEKLRESPSVERILWRIEQCWDEHFAEALLEKSGSDGHSPFVMGQILEVLLERSFSSAVTFALSLVPEPLPEVEVDRPRSAIAGALLLKHQTAAGWPTVWRAMQQDDDYADAVLSRFAWRDRHEASFTRRLSEADLAELYVWLSRRYRPSDEPEINGLVEYRAAVGQWRDGLLTELKLRGTKEAIEAINQIATELPDQSWMRWILLEAKALTRQRTWLPPTPEDIRALAQSAE